MQDGLLLETIAIVWRLGRDDQILLLLVEEDVMGGLGQLMHRNGCGCAAMNLLEKVVLLLAHHLI